VVGWFGPNEKYPGPEGYEGSLVPTKPPVTPTAEEIAECAAGRLIQAVAALRARTGLDYQPARDLLQPFHRPVSPETPRSAFFFGLPAPESVAGPSWAARAIFTPGTQNAVDFLGDRQQWSTTQDSPEASALRAWINDCGLPTLRLRLREGLETRDVGTDSTDVITVEGSGFTLTASPNASYGYLYLGAWQGPAEIPPDTTRPIHRFQALDPAGLKDAETQVARRRAGKCVACGKRRPVGFVGHSSIPGYSSLDVCQQCREAASREAQEISATVRGLTKFAKNFTWDWATSTVMANLLTSLDDKLAKARNYENQGTPLADQILKIQDLRAKVQRYLAKAQKREAALSDVERLTK
jgi:hypothetical protein